MADIVNQATRSRMMAGIRGKDTKPELAVRRYLHRAGLRYRIHVKDLPGRPDVVLPKFRAVVFVHGCFWHQHRGCPLAAMPASNTSFWRDKLEGNRERDLRNSESLRRAGYRVFLVWECEINAGRLERLVHEIVRPNVSERIVENFGDLIRAARKERGLSQESLAYKVGLEQTEISKIERGKEVPMFARALRIAEVLGLEESQYTAHDD